MTNISGDLNLFFFNIYSFYFIIYFLYFSGCVGCYLLHAGYLLRHMGSFSLRCPGSLLWCMGFSLVVAFGFSLQLWRSGFLSSSGMRAPGHVGSVVCGTWALSLRRVSSVAVASGLSCPLIMWDLSFPARDRTHVPCIGRQILYHWTTRDVPQPLDK